MLLRKVVDRYRAAGVPAVLRGAMRMVAPARYRRHFADPSPLQIALRMLAAQETFSIIQIGAYIGDTGNDPIAAFLKDILSTPREAKVVVIEPVQAFFDQLKENYKNLHGIIFENAAIAETRGVRDFYHLDCDAVAHGHPEWPNQLGSLRPDRMTTVWDGHERNESLQRFYLEHRIKLSVECVTLQDIMMAHAIDGLDLLQIDAEGYDFEILKTIDFKATLPRFINFESCLLSSEERRECEDMLLSAGYDLSHWGNDTFCAR